MLDYEHRNPMNSNVITGVYNKHVDILEYKLSGMESSIMERVENNMQVMNERNRTFNHRLNFKTRKVKTCQFSRDNCLNKKKQIPDLGNKKKWEYRWKWVVSDNEFSVSVKSTAREKTGAISEYDSVRESPPE